MPPLIIKKKKTRTMLPFVSLHVHCEHSIRDGVGTCEEYIDLAKYEMQAFTITNHGSCGQFIRQFLKCKKEGIKNIFGCEIYVNDDRFKVVELKDQIEKFKKKNKKDLSEYKKQLEEARKYHHLVILAKNEIGYKNLLKITSDAWINGFYYRPMTDNEFLKKHSEGLIVLSACMGSQIGHFLRNGKEKDAIKYIKQCKEIWGDDYYLELQLHSFKGQEEYNNFLLKQAKKLDIKLVITNDVHYPNKEDYLVQDTLLLLSNKHTWKDLKEGKKGVWTFESKELWYKNEQEIYETWKKDHQYISYDVYKKAIVNTIEVASKVDDIVITSSNKIPYFCEPEKGLDLLKKHLKKGWLNRKTYKKENLKEYIDRINMEIDTVQKLGYEHYFLIMEDIIMYAKNKYGPECVGPGRGSGGGSLINYLLQITDIDPVKHGLVFERFINLGRDDVPDVDTDFSPEIRDDIKRYIMEKWGENHTASIGTYGTFKTKAVIADVSSTYGIPIQEFRKINKLFEDDVDSHTWEELQELYPEFKEYCKKYKEAMWVASRLRGQIRNIGTTASGVCITRNNIYDELALIQRNGRILTAWMEGMTRTELGKTGNVKFDILGLRTLKILREANDLIKQRTGKRINWDKIDHDDDGAIELARNQDTDGIFQYESDTMRRMLRDAEVKTLHDLSAISGLGRPGPLRAGVDKDYCARSSGRQKYEIYPTLVEILKPTHGIMIYQEQIMKISQVMGGFTFIEADRLRKLLVKHKVDTFDAMMEELKIVKEKFINGAIERNYTKEFAEDIWDKMYQFCKYGFNLSHSLAYAIISFRCLYLKKYYPLEFFTALLNNTPPDYDQDSEGKMEVYTKNVLKYGIKILPPDINKSKEVFVIEGNDIRMSLPTIKNVGFNVAKIIAKNTPYKSIYDFIQKVKGKRVNKRTIEALINAGAFDELHENRKQLLIYFKKYFDNKKEQTKIEDINAYKINKQKNVNDFDYLEKLKLEKEYIGFYLSGHPLSKYEEFMAKNNIINIKKLLRKSSGVIGVMVKNVKKIITKKGDQMAFVLVSDQDNEVLDITVWPDMLEEYEKELKVENLIVIKLKRQENKKNGGDSWVIANKDCKRQVILLSELIKLLKKK